MDPRTSRRLAVATLLVAPPVIYLVAAELTPPAEAPAPWSQPSTPLPPEGPDPGDDAVGRLVRGYYDALNARDVDRLAEAWAVSDDTVAQHAGWPEVRGRQAILAEYRRELGAGAWEKLEPRDLRVRVMGPRAEVAFVERMTGRTDAGTRRWRRVATQVWMASPSGGYRLVAHRTLPTVLVPDGGALE